MGINYRKIDPQAVSYDVMKSRAIDTEQRAKGAEYEIEHLKTLIEKDLADANVSEQLRSTEKTAARWRRAADRAAGASPLTVLEILDIHRKLLDQWLMDIEQQHASLSAMISECTRQLSLEGADAVEDQEDIEELEEGVRQNERSLKQVEVRHGLVITALDQLDEQENVLEKDDLPIE